MHCIKFEEIRNYLKGYMWHHIIDLKNILGFIKVKIHATQSQENVTLNMVSCTCTTVYKFFSHIEPYNIQCILRSLNDYQVLSFS